ncbi:NINE protein [Collinsella aerofaciens]|uniref:NINE protein n=1 Tax=Collinsella aerofaciens TaxID=74426 RepID=UPI00359C3DA9
MEVLDQIKSLKELQEIGAISQAEFDEQKRRILDRHFDGINFLASKVQDEQKSFPPNASNNNPSEVSRSQKSKIVAGLLAICLGALGIHKFYLGYKNEGIAMLLGSLLGSLLIIGPFAMNLISFIEGIIYLTKTDSDFEAQYVLGHKGWF